jgi:hypothetical protein
VEPAVTIALATTRITVKRLDQIDVSETDPWERSTEADPLDPPFIVAAGIRAALNVAPFFRSAGSGEPGDTETVDALLMCDPVDLKYHDLVFDEKTGREWDVVWTFEQSGVAGTDHVQAKLRAVTGFGNP